jgi:signal transduction histidine kinase
MASDEALERWTSLQRFVPYVGLLVGFGLTATIRDGDWPSIPVAAGVAVAMAAYVWLTAPPTGRVRLPGPVFFAGWWVLAGALVVCSPWFGFAVFVGYLFAPEVLPGRSWFAGVVATAVLVATCQAGGLPPLEPVFLAVWAAVVAVNATLATAFTYFGMLSEQQSERRKVTIDELAEANEKLAAAMEENAGLHAQLLVQAREAGVLDERQRLAGEIHDTIAQGLTGIVAQLQAARTARDAASHDRHLDNAASLARTSLDEARRSVQALRPQQLEAARLPEALADVATRWSEVNGVPATLTVTGEARQLHPEVEVALLRSGQEALANVAKHAGASRVGVTLSYMEDLVTLDVVDDGCGFTPGTAPHGPGGFGLDGMRQRVLRVAGTLEVESTPGEGTAICATVPAIPAGAGAPPAPAPASAAVRRG